MNPNHPLQLLGQQSPADFLRHTWGNKPLLVRNAFERIPWSETPEAFGGLSLEAGVESRLYVGMGLDRRYRMGPFEEEDLTSLPDKDWTLLIQDVERWFPEASRLMQPFRFLPNARLDDLMVSIAAEGGGVGAHVDLYDVFLIQLSGKRRWRIESKPRFNLHPGEWNPYSTEGLDALTDFAPDESWDLETGDLLYLPPGFAHEGTALNTCVTASVGFRAPSKLALLKALAQATSDASKPADFISNHVLDSNETYDPDKVLTSTDHGDCDGEGDDQLYIPASEQPVADPGELPVSWVSGIYDSIQNNTDFTRISTDAVTPSLIQRALGCSLTEPRGEAPSSEEPLSVHGLREALSQGASLAPTSVGRCCWALASAQHKPQTHREHDQPVDFFVGGLVKKFPGSDLNWIRALCGVDPIQRTILLELPAPTLKTIAQWIDLGHLSLDFD